MTAPPTGLQLDLLCAVQRLAQAAPDIEQHCSTLVAQRLITCDLPRLRKHLTTETLAWKAEQTPIDHLEGA